MPQIPFKHSSKLSTFPAVGSYSPLVATIFWQTMGTVISAPPKYSIRVRSASQLPVVDAIKLGVHVCKVETAKHISIHSRKYVRSPRSRFADMPSLSYWKKVNKFDRNRCSIIGELTCLPARDGWFQRSSITQTRYTVRERTMYEHVRSSPAVGPGPVLDPTRRQ